MRKKLSDVLDDLTSRGVDFADIRVHRLTEESISTESQVVQDLSTSRSRGYGIRVFVDNAMGFAASSDFESMRETAEKALEAAKATKIAQKHPVKLAEKEAIVDHYETPVRIDPFTVSKEDKLEILFEAEQKMQDSAQLLRTEGSMNFRKENKIYADTEGSYITQDLCESGGGIQAYAASDNDIQVRSYPSSFRGNHATCGFEFIEDMQLIENASDTAREAEELLNAEECPSGHFDLVIDSSQLTLQIHESVGHPVELDRVMGYEAGLAGDSFLDAGMEGFEYGSEHVNIVADATTEGGLGTFGYDDEGVPAQKIDIIDQGKFANFLSSRDTAAELGQLSNATARADGWNNIPIVRMTNINLLPGDESFDELLSSIEYGLYLHTNKSWSIDDRRLNFQFACEIAYEIVDGKLTGNIFKNPIYTGITPEFWRSCDGVGNENLWQMYGTPNCGKGEPMQVAHVGHGSSPSRFRNVKVGVDDA